MKEDLRVYRLVVRIKPIGFRAAKAVGTVITDGATDKRILKRWVKEKIERIYEDSLLGADIEVEEIKRIKNDFFFAL